MSETDYNARLYEKMKAEQDKYQGWLVHQEPSEILNHTYEYTMREDIVMCMEELELEPEYTQELPTPGGTRQRKIGQCQSRGQEIPAEPTVREQADDAGSPYRTQRQETPPQSEHPCLRRLRCRQDPLLLQTESDAGKYQLRDS